MSFDFNDAEEQKIVGGLIPNDTIAIVVAAVRPGNEGDGGWLRGSSTGCNMLDFEFTVDGGRFDRRKFWSMFVTDGVTEGHAKAASITRSRLRAMLESAKGVSPGDTSAAAIAARQVKSWADFDGLRFIARIGVEKGKINADTGQPYADKNVFRAAITPDDEDYMPLNGVASNVAKMPAKAQTPASAKKPSWAG